LINFRFLESSFKTVNILLAFLLIITNMARMCPITGKTYQKVNDRSHSMQATIRRRQPNFVIKRIGNKKIKITARGLKTLKLKGISVNQLDLG